MRFISGHGYILCFLNRYAQDIDFNSAYDSSDGHNKNPP